MPDRNRTRLDQESTQRVQLILNQLQLQRLAVARRSWRVDGDAHRAPEILLCLDAQAGVVAEAAAALPLELLQRAVRLARPFEVTRDAVDAPSWLSAHGFASARIWLGPRDRLACVFFLGLWRLRPALEPTRLQLVESAFETLAQALAPPPWLSLAAAAATGPRDEDATLAIETRGELVPLREAVRRVERQMLRRALHLAEGNRAAAARSLAVTRSCLYRKLKEHGLLSE